MVYTRGMEFIKQYLLSFGSLLLIDSVWLTKVAPKFYKSNIGHLMTENPNLLSAGLFYLIYIAGVVVFVVSPAVADRSLGLAATRGALFGLVAYSAFDLTGMAVFKNWPVKVTIVDMLWGTILTMGVAVLATFISTRYLK